MTTPTFEMGTEEPPYGSPSPGQIQVTGPITMHLVPLGTGTWAQITFFESSRCLGWLTGPLDGINDVFCYFVAGLIVSQIAVTRPPDLLVFVDQLVADLDATFRRVNQAGFPPKTDI